MSPARQMQIYDREAAQMRDAYKVSLAECVQTVSPLDCLPVKD
jgi:hypothetical protein